VACNDEFSGHQSRAVWRAEAQTEYYIMAAAYQAIPAGLLSLSFNRAFIPENDDPGRAAAVAAGGAPVVQPAHSATGSSHDLAISCIGSYGYSLWFEVQSAAGGTLTIDTAGSDYDTVAAVLTEDSGGAFAEVACNNNAAAGTRTSRVSWPAAPGQPYLVLVGASTNRPAGFLRIQATQQ
jgi:hypothetical protein